VALDLELTPELQRLGTAREIVRGLQEARKRAGLEVSDRIRVSYRTEDPTIARVLLDHRSAIADEVLAVEFGPGDTRTGMTLADLPVEVELQKV
jgi:isoleucyl-tRNA synthetase